MINLNYFNPCCKDGNLNEKLIGRKRHIFNEILKYLELRQILIFTSMLVKKVFNFSGSYITSEKKIKRAYLENSALNYAISEVCDFSYIVEQYFPTSAHFFKKRQI